mmetsp:Transcript_15597/g.43703  ORF Transcript_15597/g.43703 Transcript_15597/m.43703 type:complete len:156 (-) Transcript_15597:253-720(-)
MSLGTLNDEEWEKFITEVDENTVIILLVNALQEDQDFEFLVEYMSFWDSNDVLESIDTLKNKLFKAAADPVISVAGGLLSRKYLHDVQLTRKKAKFWLENANNVTLNKKDYEDATKATLRLMFGPTIESKVPSIKAIKAAMSWLATRGAFKPFAG